MKTSDLLICLMLAGLTISSCTRTGYHYYDAGVSFDLATYRKSTITNTGYTLKFYIPADPDSGITGTVRINFNLANTSQPLLIDFKSSEESVETVTVNDHKAAWEYRNEHIIIPHGQLTKGNNNVLISFTAGDLSLNRNEQFLYTLFVPDRARTAFPCFDQPDLKASFKLTLVIDSSWTAISNNPVISETTSGRTRWMDFSQTRPISTYLFAFAAGRFEKVTKKVDDIEMTMFHRETRQEVVSDNIDEIFRLHAEAIRWLEEYTGIPYPFDKFGFVLIPSFQYGGMEHPGSIYYRATSLFHEKDASINQKLGRAGLIAHETSHIWFGDLVTMEWFDDVWLKEVYAGFMSDKIVNPQFPEENHDLKFLLRRYPAAYAVDRTRGTNPVIQELSNMKNAGTLYGGIIYNKAPVIMKHLELITGDTILKEGLRKYLKKFSYSNAEWQDLVNILDKMTDAGLKSWSDVWVRETGMPIINCDIILKDESKYLSISESDPMNLGRLWPQDLFVRIITGDSSFIIKHHLDGTLTNISIPANTLAYIPNSLGIAYGYFKMSNEVLHYLGQNVMTFDDPLLRGVIWLNIRENMINKEIDPLSVYKWVTASIPVEDEPQLQSLLRGMLSSIFWNYIDIETRSNLSSSAEKLLFDEVSNRSEAADRKSYFNSFVNISTTERSLDYLYNVWSKNEDVSFFLSENDRTNLAYNLALKGHPKADSILAAQLRNITNTDRKKRMEFVIPSLSKNPRVKEEFFNSLMDEKMREHEPWVTQALGFLNHPLFQEEAIKYILPGLREMEEVQETGDIFFPGQWINAILSRQNSKEAYNRVELFLDLNPDFPPNLRLKVMQAADHLYRRYAD